jgi:hypothetical protein
MHPDRLALPLRIVMEHPVPGVAIAIQRGASGKAELVPPAAASAQALVFELDLQVAGALPDGKPRFLGPFVQGPPQARFVYLCVGQAAGQANSPWLRRVKVPLGGLDWAQIEQLAPGARLVARIAGKARDGGPACATVPILPPGWSALTDSG